MTWTPTATRADVIRMVDRYVKLAFSIRSMAGKLAIDEGRLSGARGVEINIDDATVVEVFDAIRRNLITRAVHAPSARRADVTSRTGEPLRAVAPRKILARIVNGRPTRMTGEAADDTRNWRATVAAMFGKIGHKHEDALIAAARIRIDLGVTRNQLMQARSELGRLKGGGRQARDLRRHAETRVAGLRSNEAMQSDRLKSCVRSKEHRDGVELLLHHCTKTREIERTCFGD